MRRVALGASVMAFVVYRVGGRRQGRGPRAEDVFVGSTRFYLGAVPFDRLARPAYLSIAYDADAGLLRLSPTVQGSGLRVRPKDRSVDARAVRVFFGLPAAVRGRYPTVMRDGDLVVALRASTGGAG